MDMWNGNTRLWDGQRPLEDGDVFFDIVQGYDDPYDNRHKLRVYVNKVFPNGERYNKVVMPKEDVPGTIEGKLAKITILDSTPNYNRQTYCFAKFELQEQNNDTKNVSESPLFYVNIFKARMEMYTPSVTHITIKFISKQIPWFRDTLFSAVVKTFCNRNFPNTNTVPITKNDIQKLMMWSDFQTNEFCSLIKKMDNLL